MQWKVSMIVLTGLSVLCLAGCGSTRQATSSSSALRVLSQESEQVRAESLESVEKVDSVKVEQQDTLREITTISIDRNDKGDTLKVVQVTDRERVRSRDRFKAQETKIEVRVDTVYVEKRDSVYVQNTDLTNRTDKRASPLSYLQWIFWILIGLMGLIITVKVCLRKW